MKVKYHLIWWCYNFDLIVCLVLGLTICGANCLLSADYKSASKIIARTGQSEPGKGDVIVSTRSGGVGTSTVQFRSDRLVPGMSFVLDCLQLV